MASRIGIASGGIVGRFDGAVVVNGDFSATGMKSAVVVASDGVQRRVYCMESPESWFEDMGEAQLQGSGVRVALDHGFLSVVNIRPGIWSSSRRMGTRTASTSRTAQARVSW